jgi:hypothetical protein
MTHLNVVDDEVGLDSSSADVALSTWLSKRFNSASTVLQQCFNSASIVLEE